MHLKHLLAPIIACLLCCTPTFAFSKNEIAKCPSANFIKAKFTDSLNQVTRIELNKFTVKSWDNFFDPDSNRSWSIEIFADTADDYDFNEAYKNAKNTLATLTGPESPYTGIDQGYCSYTGGNDSARMIMALLIK